MSQYLKTKKILLILMIPFLSFSQDDNHYKIVKKIEEIEIREYNPLLFASYVNNSEFNDRSSSFRVLANYIFGSNERNEEIAMTSPVVIKLFNNNEMLFRMPEKYSKQNIPKPNNENIKFTETYSTQKAVIKYSGYSNTDKENEKIKELTKLLAKHNIKHNNEFELFVYDPPYKFFNRKNEISVKILK
tara:strand:- start:2059 stop:2622 length:564 start_codon:yes stop_codon:yes gene_type:complete